MMYRFDVFVKDPKGKGNKKVTSHWYPTFQEALDAQYAIKNMPKHEYTFVPREGAPQVTKVLGGYTTSKIVQDNKY